MTDGMKCVCCGADATLKLTYPTDATAAEVGDGYCDRCASASAADFEVIARDLVDEYLHYAEPRYPTAESDAKLGELIRSAQEQLNGEDRETLIGRVRAAGRERKQSKSVSLSRAQINLSEMLAQRLRTMDAGSTERLSVLSLKHLGDDRAHHIALFTDKAGATAFMMDLVDAVAPEPVAPVAPATPEPVVELTPQALETLNAYTGRGDRVRVTAEGFWKAEEPTYQHEGLGSDGVGYPETMWIFRYWDGERWDSLDEAEGLMPECEHANVYDPGDGENGPAVYCRDCGARLG